MWVLRINQGLLEDSQRSQQLSHYPRPLVFLLLKQCIIPEYDVYGGIHLWKLALLLCDFVVTYGHQVFITITFAPETSQRCDSWVELICNPGT